MAPETPILLRNRIIQLKENGQKQSHIANALGISRMSVHRILKLYEAEGSAAEKIKKKSFTLRDENRLRRLIKKYRNGSVREITGHFNQGQDKKRCISFVFKQIKLLGASKVVQKKLMIIRKYNKLRCRKLYEEIEKRWNLITQDAINKMYDSLPRRMAELLKMRGEITKY